MDLHGGHLTSSAADSSCLSLFFFNDTATTEIYTLSLHDALPIWTGGEGTVRPSARPADRWHIRARSEEHTSELQSRQYLVCRLLLEKKNRLPKKPQTTTLRQGSTSRRGDEPAADSPSTYGR